MDSGESGIVSQRGGVMKGDMRGAVQIVRWSLVAVGLLVAGPGQAADVVFTDVRIAMEATDGGVAVKELLVFRPVGEDTFENPLGFPIPLPRDAKNIQLAPEVSGAGLLLKNRDVLVTGSVPTTGRQAAVLFTLPAAEEVLQLDQPLNAPVLLAHAAWVGETDRFSLSGEGFGLPDVGRTPDGVPAIFIAAENLANGRVRLSVSGFSRGLRGYIPMAAAVLSFLLLLLGLVGWVRGRRSGDSSFS